MSAEHNENYERESNTSVSIDSYLDSRLIEFWHDYPDKFLEYLGIQLKWYQIAYLRFYARTNCRLHKKYGGKFIG